MNSKNLIAIVVIIAGLFGLLWVTKPVGQGGTQQVRAGSPSSEMLAADTRFYDFGRISMKDGLVSKVFKVTNPTSQSITLESVITSCMCTAAYIETPTGSRGPFGMIGHGRTVPKANQPVAPGETINLKVVYDPNAHGPAGVGLINRSVYLTDSEGRRMTIDIKAVVTP